MGRAPRTGPAPWRLGRNAGLTARTAGDTWTSSLASALLLVPSVIVPDEYNVLINPQHGDAAVIVATTLKRWIHDPRFFS